MGSSWALVSSTALVLVLLSSASEDEHIFQQRQIPFDLNLKDLELPDANMMQREVDWADLFDSEGFQSEQVIVHPKEQFDTVSERGSSRPALTPRGRAPDFLRYPVTFPLARPTNDNLQAICLNGDRRPQYSDSYFPASGFGQQRRKANAVNNAETWFSTCCRRNETLEREMILCCATQAWELFVTSFCTEDSSVKDRLYHCCNLKGNEKLDCFNSNAQNPNYEPTEEIPMLPLPSDGNFYFNPDNCQRTEITPYSLRGNRQRKVKKQFTSNEIEINFPPGRPTTDTIKSLCGNQNQRPLYSVKCLPRVGYELLARQAKTINRMEKGFKQCCRKQKTMLSCADRKWSDELDKFCLVKNDGQVDFHCCSSDVKSDRFNCFQSLSPDPHYNLTSATEELSLNKICDTHKILKKTFPVGFPLKNFVDQCCPLSEEDKNICFVQELEKMSGTLCSSGKPLPPAVRRCCRLPSEEAPQCISKIIMDAITKATNVLRQKKKKRCPIS